MRHMDHFTRLTLPAFADIADVFIFIILHIFHRLIQNIFILFVHGALPSGVITIYHQIIMIYFTIVSHHNMTEYDYIYSFAKQFGGYKNTEDIDEFCDWYSDHVKYYSKIDKCSYDYAHISFCAFQSDKKSSLNNTISLSKSGVMLNGLISDVPSTLDKESGIYKYGFGAQYTEERLENSLLVKLAYSYNELAVCKAGSPATRNVSIAQGVQNTKSDKLDAIYKASNWVVFVEPKIDLDFFIEQDDTKDEDLGENGIYKKNRAQQILDDISNRNMDDDHFKAAYDLINRGEEEKGLEEIRAFIEKNPNVWNAWFMLGWGMRKLGRFAEAKMAFEKALTLEGGETSDTYNELSICLLESGDIKGAKKLLEKALMNDSENTKIISNLGYVALKEGDPSMAAGYFQTVLEIDPSDKIAAMELQKLEV